MREAARRLHATAAWPHPGCCARSNDQAATALRRRNQNSGMSISWVASSPKANSEAVIARLGALTPPSMATPATEQTFGPATLTFKDTP